MLKVKPFLAAIFGSLLLMSPVHAQQGSALDSLLEDLFGNSNRTEQNQSRPSGSGQERRENGGLVLRSPVDENGVPRLDAEEPGAPAPRQESGAAGQAARNDSANSDNFTGDESRPRTLPQSREQITLSFAPLVQDTSPSVVNIFADRMVRQRSPFADDPFFERFFNRRPGGQQRQQNSLGSGVIVGADGTIITNNHVIADADSIRVVLEDGNEYEAKVLVRDEDSDLAALRIDTGYELPSLPLGDSDALLVGDLVLAIGNPFGVGKTVTSGIVSAVARSRRGLSDFGFFIQTDAAVNPGNSGGALIDMNGSLVGENTAIFSRSGGSNGIGFAIPSNMVRAILRSVNQVPAGSGQVVIARPYFGADLQPVSPDIAQQLGMRAPRGALVTALDPNGPAREAGLQPGDVVVAIGDNAVANPDAFNYRLFTAGVGARVDLQAVRRGEIKRFVVELTEEAEGSLFEEIEIKGSTPFAGAKVSAMDRRVLRRLRVRTNDPQGVIVTAVQQRSVAARFVRPGDIIRSVNGTAIRSISDLREVVSSGSRNWSYTLERRGSLVRQFVRR
ncbi:MAG: Do family serine endopeptidase [Pseudomonadota bacterium]